ncbi:DegT/DnrJ/EryC1/StrS family aminotransferase [Streptomyces sp. NBC_01185]|uniref:DegT/DnrJ/EryC1/StrS family aminotransferase n=1 Tax=Streptomyces sp. NBC_01185 TaxID=2903764 RepID=UPI00386798B6|nr:DegT/DnrJ/EryC1/StrS family aminotransferase [Streptomyces sp. NBC_01185]
MAAVVSGPHDQCESADPCGSIGHAHPSRHTRRKPCPPGFRYGRCLLDSSSRLPVPFLPKSRLLTPAEQRVAAECYARTPATGELTSGPAAAGFEAALADFLGLHAVATSSGTDGLIVALRSVGVGPGDEVIIPANSFAATENAVLACGAVLVLTDIEPGRPTLDPESAGAAVTSRTKAVLPVHLYGRLADMAALRRTADAHGLRVVEDACQAIGVTGVGQHSDATVLSFNPYKNFGLTGKAGAVLTGDGELAARARAIAYHGFHPDRKNVKTEPWGLNAKIDNSLASVALGLLPGLTLKNYRRAFLAERYITGLAELHASGLLVLPSFSPDHAWHLFTVRVPGGPAEREEIRARMRSGSGVETDIYYPVLTHHQRTPLHKSLFSRSVLPHTEQLHTTAFQLPLHNQLSLTEQDRVIEALHAAVRPTAR